MKAHWPMKQTMAIRWSAASWRPTIRIVAGGQGQRGSVLRIVRAPQVNDGYTDTGAGI